MLIDGTFNILQACVEAGVRRAVAASSASVYGMANEFPTAETHHLFNNRTLYGAAKMATTDQATCGLLISNRPRP